MTSEDIIYCGGLFCDLTAYAPHFPKPGESVLATKFIRGFGGGSANQCYIAKLMGAKTALVGKLGDDDFGKEFKTYLNGIDVNHDHVTVAKGTQMNTGIIIVSETGENSIVGVMGATESFTVEDANSAADKLFMKDEEQVLVCTYELPRKPLLKLLKRAKENDILTLLNAAPWPGEPWEEVYPYADIVIINETEAELSTSMSVKTVSDAESAGRELLRRGCKAVLITLGKNGVLAVGDPQGDAVHVPAPEVKAVDSSGAGDAFVGSLSFYLRYYPELSMKEKLRRACAVASITVQAEGTLASYEGVRNLPEDLLQ